MTITDKELKAIAKEKNLHYEQTHGMYHAYIHITADDTDGLAGRSPDEFNVTIMTTINPNTEQIARESAKIILEKLPKYDKVTKKRRKSRKDTVEESDFEDSDIDNSINELESKTQDTANKNLALI